ncbi:MAG: type II toxin-antitoxin system HicB family antitoxin [Dysgonamonadaceae bacterium]|jgi:predicted RNase H-like HicB family nuclease|nr:type II toxin-antitoxin system HicB family antitoxin [Dysgonamonadaceae bacterium]
MKKLKVVVCKANKGVSAHLPELDGYVIARDTVEKLKKDLKEGVQFHIEGLYEEEKQEWMNSDYIFEYKFKDIPTLVEAYNGFINQSSLARIVGINEGQMRQYASGVKHPTKKTLKRIEDGVKQYAGELQSVAFDYA